MKTLFFRETQRKNGYFINIMRVRFQDAHTLHVPLQHDQLALNRCAETTRLAQGLL